MYYVNDMNVFSNFECSVENYILFYILLGWGSGRPKAISKSNIQTGRGLDRAYMVSTDLFVKEMWCFKPGE